MLGNTIALLTLAAMFAFEAKRSEPPASYGLYTVATIVALLALSLQPIVDRAPKIGDFLTSIFGMPVAWFALFLGLFFVLRPYWTKTPSSPPGANDIGTTVAPYDDRALRAEIQKFQAPLFKGLGQIDGLASRVVEIERDRARETMSERLQSAETELSEIGERLSSELDRLPKMPKEPLPTLRYHTLNEDLRRVGEELSRHSQHVSHLVGIPVDLTRHPNFDKNQARPVPGCSAIEDQAVQHDYRRTYDQIQSAQLEVRSIADSLKFKRSQMDNPKPESRRGPLLTEGEIRRV